MGSEYQISSYILYLSPLYLRRRGYTRRQDSKHTGSDSFHLGEINRLSIVSALEAHDSACQLASLPMFS